jgi:hypothetical protein
MSLIISSGRVGQVVRFAYLLTVLVPVPAFAEDGYCKGQIIVRARVSSVQIGSEQTISKAEVLKVMSWHTEVPDLSKFTIVSDSRQNGAFSAARKFFHPPLEPGEELLCLVEPTDDGFVAHFGLKCEIFWPVRRRDSADYYASMIRAVKALKQFNGSDDNAQRFEILKALFESSDEFASAWAANVLQDKIRFEFSDQFVPGWTGKFTQSKTHTLTIPPEFYLSHAENGERLTALARVELDRTLLAMEKRNRDRIDWQHSELRFQLLKTLFTGDYLADVGGPSVSEFVFGRLAAMAQSPDIQGIELDRMSELLRVAINNDRVPVPGRVLVAEAILRFQHYYADSDEEARRLAIEMSERAQHPAIRTRLQYVIGVEAR